MIWGKFGVCSMAVYENVISIISYFFTFFQLIQLTETYSGCHIKILSTVVVQILLNMDFFIPK